METNADSRGAESSQQLSKPADIVHQHHDGKESNSYKGDLGVGGYWVDKFHIIFFKGSKDCVCVLLTAQGWMLLSKPGNVIDQHHNGKESNSNKGDLGRA